MSKYVPGNRKTQPVVTQLAYQRAVSQKKYRVVVSETCQKELMLFLVVSRLSTVTVLSKKLI